jgi:arylsulfatase A-like enzyme
MLLGLVVAAAATVPSTARAAPGDCGQPASQGPSPTVTDCLQILRAAVGSSTCDPPCICAPTGSLPAKASDALLCIRKVSGQDVSFDCPCSTGGPERPNIVFILLDDASDEQFAEDAASAFYPNIHELLYDRGTYFDSYLVSTPVCGPSRASTLRGQLAHNTGIESNFAAPEGSPPGTPTGGFGEFYDRGYPDDELGVWMRRAGYRTYFVGKYHNGNFPGGSGDLYYTPPGWDEFYGSLGDEYFGTVRLINGTRPHDADDVYRTDQEADDAIMLLTEHVARDPTEPFLLYLAPLTPHASTSTRMMAVRHRSRFTDEIAPRLPDFNEADTSDKASNISSLPLLTQEEIDLIDVQHRARLQSMLSIDEMVAHLMEALDSLGLLDDTYVFLTSDNGYHLGNHRLFAKRAPYERVVSVPLVVRGPGVAEGVTKQNLLMNVDLAPTFLELAGAAAPDFVDGRSFVPVLHGSVPVEAWRTSAFVENWENAKRLGIPLYMRFDLLRLQHEAYLEWGNGEKEYYDLAADPFQLDNRYEQLSEQARRTLASRLDAWRHCAAAGCRTLGGGSAPPAAER